MKKINLIVLAIIGFFTLGSAANPVTMTDFHGIFNYLNEVNHVSENGLIDGRVVSFLVNENNPIDQKAAVINALVANNKTKSNALTFRQFVARKYKENWENLDLNKLNGEELFCLGYITIIDEDGNSPEGFSMLEMAAEKVPASMTINLINALAKAQNMIKDGDNCGAWETFNAAKNNTSFNNDLDNGIAGILTSVMESYGSGCQ